MNFLGLTDEEARGEMADVRYSIISVPYDKTATYVKGAARGPAAIIEASGQVELFDEELGSEPWKTGIKTLKPLDVKDLDPDEMVEAVRLAVETVASNGRIPVVLGGEHSVTVGAVRALKERYKGLSVLQLDAHADLRDTYEGISLNHACVARRILDAGCPLVQVGIRSMSREEGEFLSAAPRGVKTFYARDIIGNRSMDTDDMAGGLTDDVYITIDLDVFDPSIMPSTGTPEPGGLSWYEVLETVKAVASEKRVVGFDVVELSPVSQAGAGNVAPDFMAARLVYKLMAYINDTVVRRG